jgi:hypothetical protein
LRLMSLSSLLGGLPFPNIRRDSRLALTSTKRGGRASSQRQKSQAGRETGIYAFTRLSFRLVSQTDAARKKAKLPGQLRTYSAWKNECCCCCYGRRMRSQILKTWDQSFGTVLFKHSVSPAGKDEHIFLYFNVYLQF